MILFNTFIVTFSCSDHRMQSAPNTQISNNFLGQNEIMDLNANLPWFLEEQSGWRIRCPNSVPMFQFCSICLWAWPSPLAIVSQMIHFRSNATNFPKTKEALKMMKKEEKTNKIFIHNIQWAKTILFTYSRWNSFSF